MEVFPILKRNGNVDAATGDHPSVIGERGTLVKKR